MSASKRLGFLLTSLLIAVLAMPVFGQATGQDQTGGGQNNGAGQNNPGAQNNGGGGGFRGRGNFNPMDFYKQQLGASDDEFAAIQPKIQTVMQLQRDANAGRGRGFFGGRGGGGGPRGGFGGGGFGPPSTQPSPVQDALQDLRTTLDDATATTDTIKAKLDTLRQARSKARQDLAVAQQDLKSVLTQRQEAVMVLLGLLD
ncbi:MAG: hypothetical protein ABSB74_16720 [Tepidisphaeraceae bacterium]